RLAVTYRLPLWSVVFYVGTGAGGDDTGGHAIQGPAAVAPLVWHYQVGARWRMAAEDLLALDQPALLALVGQTRLDHPAVVLPAVVARLRQGPRRRGARASLDGPVGPLTARGDGNHGRKTA